MSPQGPTVHINEWPGRRPAEGLRQWPHILKLAEVGAKRPFLGVVLLGSFARDGADDLSDVDFVFFAAEGASSPRGSSDIVSTLLTPRAGTTRVRL